MNWRRAAAALRSPSVVYLISSVLARTASFVLVPLYTRALTVREYGDYFIFLTAVALTSTVVSMGLAAAIPRYYFGESDPTEGLRSAGAVARLLAVVTFASAACISALVLLCAGAGDQLWNIRTLLLGVVASSGMAVSGVPVALLKAQKKAYSASCFQMVQFTLTAAGGVMLVGTLGRGYFGALEAIAGANCVLGILALGYIASLPARAIKPVAADALRFAVPFVPHFSAQWALAVADRWLLKWYGMEGQLGQFALAGQMISPTNMVVTSWNDATSADMGDKFREGGIGAIGRALPRLRLTYLVATLVPGLITILLIPVGMWLVGDSFHGAFAYLPLLVLALMPNALYYANFHLVFFAGRSGFVGVATVLAAALNLAANVVLIPAMGAWGAITAQLFAFSCRALFLLAIGARVQREAGGA